MNNEKEIERMAIALQGEIDYWTEYVQDGYSNVDIEYEKTAKNLINKGIGDKKQAVEEFVQKFWDEICVELNDVLGENPHIRVRVKRHIDNALNRIFIKLYGADE